MGEGRRGHEAAANEQKVAGGRMNEPGGGRVAALYSAARGRPRDACLRFSNNAIALGQHPAQRHPLTIVRSGAGAGHAPDWPR
jgi:hypothetical protein